MLASSLIAAQSLLALQQSSPFQLAHRAIPETVTSTVAQELADVDGDGRLDLVQLTSTSSGNLSVLLGRGNGVFDFGSPGLTLESGYSNDLALADFDGDGDLDAVVAFGNPEPFSPPTKTNDVLLNDGSGNFTALPGAFTDPQDSVAVAAVDLDGDGWVDVAVATAGGARLYRGDGTGQFVAVTAGFPVDALDRTAVEIADLDGDGISDLFFAGRAGSHLLLLGDGLGGFVDASGQVPATPSDVLSVAIGDIDNASGLDIVLPGAILLNDGAGIFSISTAPSVPQYTRDIDLAFVDGDSRIDAVTPRGLFLNTSLGLTVVETDLDLDYYLPFGYDHLSTAVGDVDGDGDVDATLGRTYSPTRLLLGRGDGTLEVYTLPEPWVESDPYGSLGAAVGDIDGDGDPDVVVAGGGSTYFEFFVTRASVRINDGTGRLSYAGDRFAVDDGRTRDVALGDVDGDGDLDVLLAQSADWDGLGQGLRLHFNDGTGDFQQQPFAVIEPGTGVMYQHVPSVAFGDVDNDGDLDFVAGSDQTDSWGPIGGIYRNDGTGDFTRDFGAITTQQDSSFDVVLADFDGDGNLDHFGANAPVDKPWLVATGEDRVWIGDGTGDFTEALGSVPYDEAESWLAAVGDVDGDGDLDLWVDRGFGENSPGGQDILLLNDGNAKFIDAVVPAPDSPVAGGISFGDADLDGDLDLVSVNPNRLFRGDGSGSFAPGETLIAYTILASGVAFTDIDGDGDEDLYLAGFGSDAGVGNEKGTDYVLTNVTRYLGWERIPSVGYPLDVQLCVDEPAVASIWLAPLAAQIELPFGTVWLDPATALVLDTLTPAGGCTGSTYPIPADAALVGAEAWIQAAVAPLSGAAPWLSNVEPLPFTSL